ncbi:ornithine carbamoyltransferase [Plantactinospora sp. WMMC1484]|uniref:ornithine carbamoyltransferase n=1 Tax=Plantactinospora sp. WMMC1484 TaxID=3404122 RepID=UPI003BF4BAD8
MNGRTRRRSLLSIADLSADELVELVRRSSWHARADRSAAGTPLAGSVVGTYFRTTSTRTRTSFTVAAQRLGAGVVAYGPHDLQENTGETVSDTARVLSGMLDALVARTAADPAELRALADQERMAVVNAMSADEHPTQAIADLSVLSTLRGRLDGLRVCYLGEGNSTAAALALALARIPDATLHLRTPEGYGLPAYIRRMAMQTAALHGAVVDEQHDPHRIPEAVDVVYTARWQTTGSVKPDPSWRTSFTPFRVTTELMDRLPNAHFMHDLPAHRGVEVDAEVLDGPRSIAFTQARHKLYSAMAVLEWVVRGAW